MALTTQFLTSIRGFVVQQNGDMLRDWLRVEQNIGSQYFDLAQELRSSFRPGSQTLDELIEKCFPEEEPTEGHGSPWPGFVSFMKDYMHYWRDLNFDDLLGLYRLLSGLLVSCATALLHPSYGNVMLRTSISISESLSKLVMILNKRPDLTSQLRVQKGEEGPRKSFVENAADTIQRVFSTCLRDRSPIVPGRQPEGNKVGIYITANLVLRLLFACRKPKPAVQMFVQIEANGPPLSMFPASQRVTYLYYLGRWNFENNNFIRASHCLETAYYGTPQQFVKHRRLILTYLMPSNILLGRFPSKALLLRPESTTLREVFTPVIEAVKKGDFIRFQHALKTHEDFLFRNGLFVTLNYRLRPLIWRSFTRRIFLLTYRPPPPDDVLANRRSPTLDLSDVLTAATYVQRRLEGWLPAQPIPKTRVGHTNEIFLKAVANSVKGGAGASTLAPPPGGPKKLRPSEGLLWGNLSVDMDEVEGIVATLIGQGLLFGFIAHSAGKFAVKQSKQKGGALSAGWPKPVTVIRERLEDPADLVDVPAWKV